MQLSSSGIKIKETLRHDFSVSRNSCYRYINTHIKRYVYPTFYAALFKEFSLEVAKMLINQGLGKINDAVSRQ